MSFSTRMFAKIVLLKILLLGSCGAGFDQARLTHVEKDNRNLYFYRTDSQKTTIIINFDKGKIDLPQDKIAAIELGFDSGIESTQSQDESSMSQVLTVNNLVIQLRASALGCKVIITCPSYQTGLAVNMAKQIMTFPNLSEDIVNRVKARIMSMISQVESSQSDIAYRMIDDEMFPQISKYPLGTSGALSSLGATDARDAMRLLDQSNISSIICISPLNAGSLERIVGNMAKSPYALDTKELNSIPGFTKAKGVKIIRRRYASPQTDIFFSINPVTSEFSPKSRVIETILSYLLNGLEGRFLNELRVNRGLTYTASAFIGNRYRDSKRLMGRSSMGLRGIFSVENANVRRGLEGLKYLLKSLSEEGISEEDLRRAKEYIKDQPKIFGDHLIPDFIEMMDIFGIKNIDEYNKCIDAVSLTDVNDFLRKISCDDGMVIAIVGGNEK